MRRSKSLVAAVSAMAVPLSAVLTLGATAGAAAEGGHTPVWDKGTSGERYVALGDSFVSGPGITPQRPGQCTRSERNFPTLVAIGLDVQAFTDASCGGAVLADLSRPQKDNPPQLDALAADTSLVTFGTLGGNDVGLVSLATSCITSDCAGTPGDANHVKVEATRDALVAGIRETKLRSPDAVIAVIGYGTYLPPGGCPATLPMTAAESDYLQGVIDHLSDVLEDVAADEGTLFVDMRDLPGALDHTACAAPAEQWVRAINTYNDGSPLHPSSAGMAAMAAHVRSVVEQAWDSDPEHPIPSGPRTPAPSETTTTPSPTATATPSATPSDVMTTMGSDGVVEAKLDAALDRVRFTARCRTSDNSGERVVRFAVRRGDDLVERVTVRIGGKRVGRDSAAPYVLKRRVRAIDHLDGRIRARVVVRDGHVTRDRTLVAKRPGCLR
ncbi:SGNH/GDSL hydrolase family protein [Nocardioides piscis]|uniref:SGNH/GDSL hydrolase family protein n=1 Tax=Nocardioides piscis TaxID=2714938 RepID=A0A6G7YDW4_9ACTN|nr:SGNH/GDSL hydrolase family protein [Nocardioides piscis]QIK74960.1 SGNH/GDSL hydrolase family protein [Nocardioides piscis]